MHRLGVRVRLVGKVGDDLFGRVVLGLYRELDPQLADTLNITGEEATSYTIVINPPERDRAYLHCSGANETFGAADVRDQHLAGARLFHFGYPPLMPRMYADGGDELRELFDHAGRAGLVTALDMCVPDPNSDAGRADWPAVLATALPAVDVFAPSIDELLFMIDRERFDRLVRGDPLPSVVDRACLLELTDRLIAMGSAVIAVKLGDHGLYLRTAADRARIGAICQRLQPRRGGVVRAGAARPLLPRRRDRRHDRIRRRDDRRAADRDAARRERAGRGDNRDGGRSV